MNIRVFVLLINVFTLYGYGSRTDWMKQYLDKCDKLSGLYQELIGIMENPNKQPQLSNGETVEGNKTTAGTADIADSSRNHGKDTPTKPVTCNQHQFGINSTGLENGMIRLEHIMTMLHSGISDEKSARVKNTQSVIRIEANVEDKFDVLKDETEKISKHLTEVSNNIGNIVKFEANVQGYHKTLKDDTVMISRHLSDLTDTVENIVKLEANAEENINVLKNETARLSKRLSNLSNKVFELDKRNQQINVMSEQNNLKMDILSDKLDKMYTTIMLRNNINVALQKPAIKSSTSSSFAGAATDGNRNAHYDGSSCTHTRKENNPWWKVNLLGQYFISRVVIINRLDCCGFRLRDLSVTVSNTTDGEETLCGHFKGPSTDGATETIWCAPDLIGQFIKIQINRPDGILTLCEVEVY